MTGWVAWALLAGPLAFLVYTHRFFSPSHAVLAVQLVGIAIVVWARATFGLRSLHAGSTATEGGLVTSGPYRFVRHPIYAGAMIAIGAVLIEHHDVPAIVAIAFIFVALGIRIVAEERSVLKRYPDYAAYAERTKRLVPWIF